MLDCPLAFLFAYLLERVKFVFLVVWLLIKQFFMSFRVWFILALLQDEFSFFLHSDLNGIFTSSPHFLHSVLLPCKNLLRLNDLPTLILHQKVLDRVVWFERVMTLEICSCVFRRRDHASRGALVDRYVGGCQATTTRWIVQGLSFVPRLLNEVLLRWKDKLGQVGVRLRQVERLWLARVITTSTITLKQILSRLEEVVRILRVDLATFCNRHIASRTGVVSDYHLRRCLHRHTRWTQRLGRAHRLGYTRYVCLTLNLLWWLGRRWAFCRTLAVYLWQIPHYAAKVITCHIFGNSCMFTRNVVLVLVEWWHLIAIVLHGHPIGQLAEAYLRILRDWMRHDWHRTHHAHVFVKL